MNEEDDLYKIENYSDTDLFRILDLTNPTNRELEAKILMEIDKYDNIDESSAKQLKDFFDNVYKHFFEDEDTPSDPTPNVPTHTVDVEFGKSDLNPIFKETDTRQIQLDSAFRDFENYKTSTDYLINLSEVLHNVVSLKLQSVSIPYDVVQCESDDNKCESFSQSKG